MTDIIKGVPIPTAGVALGLAALGNLLSPLIGFVRPLCGVLSALLVALVICKMVMFPQMIKEDFKNPILARLSSELKGISSMNEDDQADIMEGAIGYIYAYAKDVRINLDMKKCPYDQAQLDAMSYVAFSQAKKGA